MKSLLLRLGFWRWMINPLDFRFLVLFFVFFRFDEKETTEGNWLMECGYKGGHQFFYGCLCWALQ
jgi:hypothetical protein